MMHFFLHNLKPIIYANFLHWCIFLHFLINLWLLDDNFIFVPLRILVIFNSSMETHELTKEIYKKLALKWHLSPLALPWYLICFWTSLYLWKEHCEVLLAPPSWTFWAPIHVLLRYELPPMVLFIHIVPWFLYGFISLSRRRELVGAMDTFWIWSLSWRGQRIATWRAWCIGLNRTGICSRIGSWTLEALHP